MRAPDAAYNDGGEKTRAPAQVDAGVTHEAAGVILFKHIFRIAPQALPLFSFGRVEGAEVNDALFAQEALKAHATKVVATVATCARKSTFTPPRGPRHRRDLAHRSRRPSACSRSSTSSCRS